MQLGELQHDQGYDLDRNPKPYWGAVRSKWPKVAATSDDVGGDCAVLWEESCDTPPPLLPGTTAIHG